MSFFKPLVSLCTMYFYSSNHIYFGHKEPIKTKNFLDFLSARVKICEVHVNFKTTKGSHQSPNFDTFKCSGENLPKFSCLCEILMSFVKFMSILKRQVSCCSPIFVSFFIVMTHDSPVNLKLVYLLFWTKESYQSSNFDTFECTGENLQNSSCRFPSKKSVFLQIFHHSSMT